LNEIQRTGGEESPGKKEEIRPKAAGAEHSRKLLEEGRLKGKGEKGGRQRRNRGKVKTQFSGMGTPPIKGEKISTDN